MSIFFRTWSLLLLPGNNAVSQFRNNYFEWQLSFSEFVNLQCHFLETSVWVMMNVFIVKNELWIRFSEGKESMLVTLNKNSLECELCMHSAFHIKIWSDHPPPCCPHSYFPPCYTKDTLLPALGPNVGTGCRHSRILQWVFLKHNWIQQIEISYQSTHKYIGNKDPHVHVQLQQ